MKEYIKRSINENPLIFLDSQKNRRIIFFKHVLESLIHTYHQADCLASL